MLPPTSNTCRRPLLLVSASIWTLIVASACTGLAAGPESKAQLPVPASRDSAYVRARRALQAETFTMDVVDSSGGRLAGTRYPSNNAKLGSGAACRVKLMLNVQGDAQKADVTTISQWVASTQMSSQASQVCEQERAQVVERIGQTVVPPGK
jgi:hypothetical protein